LKIPDHQSAIFNLEEIFGDVAGTVVLGQGKGLQNPD
jgi:hypothetical protein